MGIDFSSLLKQRLCLSAYAWSVIEQDRMSFSIDGKSIPRAGLLNCVFSNFYERAEASVPLRIVERQRELDLILDGTPPSVHEVAVARLMGAYKSELIANIKKSVSQGASDLAWNMSIQKRMGDLLDTLSKRNFFSYDIQSSELTRGKYMAAVFEEYAKLPYVEREKIYLDKLFVDIEDAIRYERAMIIIYAQAKKTIYILPHSLEPDKLSMYNYLIGYARPAEKPDQPLSLRAFRFSKIHSAEVDKHGKPGSGKLSAKQRLWIKKSRATHGTMFISDEEQIVQVSLRLTAEGVKKYTNQIHMRPPPSDTVKGVNEGKNTFRCTERQAEYYFFKFGKDVEILTPHSLREKFALLYSEAVTLYDG